MELVKSAQRTNGNSPAIYRWVRNQYFASSPRSGRQNSLEDVHYAARFTGFGELLRVPLPALKCWAIFVGPLRGLCMVLFATLILIAASFIASAQRKPSEATRPFVVMSAQSLDDLQKTLQPDNKTSELIDSGGMQLRVAVQHEKNKTGAAAELHDASDDVYYVLDGSATLVLGGKLDSPKETDSGEWRSPRILDGKTIEIKKGDVIIVPRGTPHQRSTENKDFTMLLIKIYAEPLKKKP
jgi:mannose-6-phosphate isomerase-like protein (cupin superfamily)